MRDKLLLRPHHALCIGFFEGRGYSEEFVRNMRQVISALKGDTLIQLTLQPDILCSCCPLRASGDCFAEKKAAGYDAALLRLTGLSDGEVLTWKELRRSVNEAVLSCGRLGTVCGDCRWYEICSDKNTAKGD